MRISPEERRAQKRRWYEANKESECKKSRERAKALKVRRRSLLPCPCFLCDDPDNTVIQWHHVDDTEKEFEIFGGNGGTCSEERWWNEVLKCIPVCANCHLKIHKNKLCLLPQKLLTQNLLQ